MKSGFSAFNDQFRSVDVPGLEDLASDSCLPFLESEAVRGQDEEATVQIFSEGFDLSSFTPEDMLWVLTRRIPQLKPKEDPNESNNGMRPCDGLFETDY